jgi:hypothetical protein
VESKCSGLSLNRLEFLAGLPLSCRRLSLGVGIIPPLVVGGSSLSKNDLPAVSNLRLEPSRQIRVLKDIPYSQNGFKKMIRYYCG